MWAAVWLEKTENCTTTTPMPKCQIVKKVDPPWFGIATTTYIF